MFEAGDGRRSPDADGLIASMATISLIADRRYLVADGVEAWGKADTEKVAEALAAIPPETTIALVAHGKAPAKLGKAVEAAGGEQLIYDAPRERELPKRLVADAQGPRLHARARRRAAAGGAARPAPAAPAQRARAACAVGGGGGTASASPELEAIISDTSEEAIWTLADAITEGDEAARSGSPSGWSRRARRCRGSSTRWRPACGRG